MAARDAASQDGQPTEAGTLFGDWLVWATQRADRIDPLKESPPSVVDRKSEVEPVYISYYGQRKPEPLFKFPKPIWRVE